MLLSKVPEKSKNILVEERGSRIQVKHYQVCLDRLLLAQDRRDRTTEFAFSPTKKGGWS